MTCTSLSPKSNHKSVHSLLRSIAGSPSSSSSSPNFPNCSSPRESASVYAAYLRSHFSVSQPKALRSRAKSYLTELRRATCSVEFHSSFCSPFSLAEFLAAASNLSSSSTTGPDNVAYPMLKHLGFNKPRPGSRTILSTIDFSKAFDSVWHPTLFHKLISAGLHPCFARWTQSFLSDRRASVVYQNHKSRSFRVRRGVPQGSVLGLVLFLFSLMIFRPLCLLPSAALFTLTIWPFGPLPPRSLRRWRPHKELCFDWSAGLSTGVFLSIRENVRPPSSQWTPTRLTSSPTSSYSAPASVLIPLQLFLGSPSTALFPFLSMYLR